MSVERAYGSIADLYIALFDSIEKVGAADRAFITRHLSGVAGPVFDLGCGPGHLTAHLRDLGCDVTGIDLTPEFVAHARAAHPSIPFVLGSMDDLDVTGAGGILAWYSLIHRPPHEIDGVLARFRRALRPGGTVVLGFFDGDEVAPFDHRVTTAYFWPAAEMARRLERAGFTVTERQQRPGERPDRPYAMIAAVAAGADVAEPGR